VNIPFFSQFIDDSGTVRPNDCYAEGPAGEIVGSQRNQSPGGP
jgi:hypothetical protein